MKKARKRHAERMEAEAELEQLLAERAHKRSAHQRMRSSALPHADTARPRGAAESRENPRSLVELVGQRQASGQSDQRDARLFFYLEFVCIMSAMNDWRKILTQMTRRGRD